VKVALVALLFAASTFAQSQSASLPAACGPENVSSDMKLDSTQHAMAQPEPGKALVYFIQDKGPFSFSFFGGAVDTRIGVDGAWVGAERNNSYFTVSVEPGEHHVCADLRSTGEDVTELAHFTAEAGKRYFFRDRIIPTPYGYYLLFDPVDSDQAMTLIDSFPLSVWRAKK
jgi:guanyl-specific ribonuclease Sa